MQGQYLFGDIPMDPNDDALHPPWVTVPNAMAQFSAFGLGPTPDPSRYMEKVDRESYKRD